MRNCSECKHWIKTVSSVYLHRLCAKQKCMVCREVGATYDADNDCFEAKEEES
jgi:hypothetical protein